MRNRLHCPDNIQNLLSNAVRHRQEMGRIPGVGIGGMRLKLRFRYTPAVNRKRPCETIPAAPVPDCARANAPCLHPSNRFTHRAIFELRDLFRAIACNF